MTDETAAVGGDVPLRGGDDPLYTLSEAARLVGRTTKAVRSRVDRGALSVAGTTDRGERLVSRSALIEAGLMGPDGAPPSRRSVAGDVVDMLAERVDVHPVQLVEARLDVNLLLGTMMDLHREDVERVAALTRSERECGDLRGRVEVAEREAAGAVERLSAALAEAERLRVQVARLEAELEGVTAERDAAVAASKQRRRWWSGG